MMERLWSYCVSLLLLAAVVMPGFRDPAHDGFPLSTYPMFSGRQHSEVSVVHVVGFSKQGRHRVIPPRLVTSEEVMQALVTIKLAVRRGRAGDLCQTVASVVAKTPQFDDIERLEVRTDWYDGVEYFTRSRSPRRTVVHARCPIASGARSS